MIQEIIFENNVHSIRRHSGAGRNLRDMRQKIPAYAGMTTRERMLLIKRIAHAQKWRCADYADVVIAGEVVFHDVGHGGHR